jgi:4-hydroxy-3-methylbut-2-enyl diphosphate reductase
MSYLELKDLFETAKELYPNVIIEEEICNATSSRQKAIADLEDCDLLYVVGDKKSNNTNKLADIAVRHGIKKVLLIQNYLDIDKDDLKGVNKVYVTAGASTPPSLINEVIDFLRQEAAQQLSE